MATTTQTSDELEIVPVVSAEVVEATERAQISEIVATAKKWPRDTEDCVKRAIKRATASREIAEGCHYSIPRDGKYITGPSIRLAKIMCQCWGNCRHTTMLVGNDGSFVKVRAIFYDCESNHLSGEEVGRSIVNKKGVRYSQDMIQTTAAAAASIALRKAILNVIPDEYVEAVSKAAKRKIYSSEVPIGERRQKMLDKFASRQISKEQVLASLKYQKLEQITAEDCDQLAGMFTSIAEGLASKDELFPPLPQEPSVPLAPLAPEETEARDNLSEAQKRIKAASEKEKALL